MRPPLRACLIASTLLFAACTGEIEGVIFGDEGAVIALEGDALAAELAGSPIRESAAGFARIGVVWDADRPEAIEYSLSADGREWSQWTAAEVSHVESGDSSSFVGQVGGAAVADGDPTFRFYRLRGGAGVATYARLELLAAPAEESTGGGSNQGFAGRIAGVVINDRASWGARPTRCSAGLGAPYRMAIHHTETPTNDSLSPEARLRQIQSYHMDVRGWCDIGYHYLMSRDGRLWEGRPAHLLGAHSGGANTGNVGIAVMGAHDAEPITGDQLRSLSGLVAAVAAEHGISIDRSAIKGHREYKSTTCPGDALFAQLETIVERARDGGGDGDGDGDPGDDSDGTCPDASASDGPWSCGGLTGTTTNPDGVYYTTSFGCWVDEDGVAHSDGGDNCVPACSLASVGCDGLTGPQCEREINWYTAGSDRWGCGTRLQVTNPDNGKSAVLMVIDRGPNCTIENRVDFWVLDMSYRASYYLFGEPTAATERADVDVEVVPDTTPLGPSFADVCQ